MNMTQISLPSSADAEHPQSDLDRNDNTRQIVTDVAYRQLAIVNVIFVGFENAGDGNWVLVDAGIPGSAGAIRPAAQATVCGSGPAPPVIMTPGGFAHVGAVGTPANEGEGGGFAPAPGHPLLAGSQ